MADPPTVSILLLGDSDTGKSTFLSSISHGRSATRVPSPSDSVMTLLRDLDQPFVWDVRMYNRPYRFEFSDTASPENYTLLSPDFVVLCYDVSRRETLAGVRERWRKEVVRTWSGEREGRMPIMLLGLKRDLRGMGEGWVEPEEAYGTAQEMRCDCYAECSAVTGELLSEVFEDMARIAAKTTTQQGALREPGCAIM